MEPVGERLSSPRGAPLTALNWADVRTRLAENEDYLVATSDPDGHPHVVPVLGVWLEDAVCFRTARQARKARNLMQNDGCAVTVPGPDVDLVVEGTAHLVTGADRLQRVADLFGTKWPLWHPFVVDGEFYDPASQLAGPGRGPRPAPSPPTRACLSTTFGYLGPTTPTPWPPGPAWPTGAPGPETPPAPPPHLRNC